MCYSNVAQKLHGLLFSQEPTSREEGRERKCDGNGRHEQQQAEAVAPREHRRVVRLEHDVIRVTSLGSDVITWC